MKKFYLLLFVTVNSTTIARAQIPQDLQFKKGDKLLGGSISAFHTTRSVFNNNTTSYLNISPSFGVFTKPNRLTGVSLQLGSSLNTQHNVGVALYKQYWSTLGKNIYFIMQGQVGAGYNTEKSGDRNNLNIGSRHNQNYTLSASMNPGFAYRFNRRLVVDAFLANFISIGYTHATSTNTFANGFQGTLTTNSVSLVSGLNAGAISNIGIGFRYIF